MKKTSNLLLALCVGAPLLAQAPGVSVYGILDTGVAHVDHALNFSDDFVVGTNPQLAKGVRTGTTGLFNGGLSGTRVGLKGSADLVDGWKAIFTLESAIHLGTGRINDATESLAQNGGKSTSAGSAVSGQLFARGAFAGISHETYGTLTFGRQQALLLDIMPGYDANGFAQLFTPVGFAGSFAGGGVTENSRVDNSVKYRVKFSGLTVSALYKIAGTKGPDATAATGASQVTLEYAQGPFGVYAGYQSLRNGVTFSANVAGSVKATVLDTTTTNLGAKYKIGSVLVAVGYQKIQFEDPSAGDAAYYLGLNPVAPATLTNQFAYGQQIGSYTVNSIGPNAKEQTLLSLTAAWDVTAKFKLSAGYYHVGINDYSVNAPTSAKGSQVNAYTSLIADYAVTKAFDAYLGLMSVKASGHAINLANGWIGADGYDTTKNSTYGFGLRYKF